LLDIVDEIRQLSQSLVPPSLSDIGLIESIEDLCEPLKTSHGYVIEFYHQPFDESRLPDNMRLMLFRIIQEQINNIVRHAETRNVFIGLQALEKIVLLTISDNGKGFSMNSIKRGLGFDNIATRVDLFGGKLKIEASPGKGCSISVSIPLS
jgi:signal transduction histidine kinase